MKPAIKYIPLKTQGKVDDGSYCVYNSSGNQVLRVYTVEDTGCARDINTRYSVPLYDTGYSIYKDTAHTQPHTMLYTMYTSCLSGDSGHSSAVQWHRPAFIRIKGHGVLRAYCP